MSIQPNDIAYVMGGIPALQNGVGGNPSGQIQQYQIANISAGGGIKGGNAVVSQIANGTITAAQLANNIIGPTQIANGSITSNQISPDNILHYQVTANATAVNAMGTVPIVVANAPGANVAYKVVGFGVSEFPGTGPIAATLGANIVLQANTSNVVAANIAATVITGNTAARAYVGVTGNQTPLANAPLSFTTANNANFSGLANTTVVFDVWAMAT